MFVEAELLEQERQLQFSGFTNADAIRLGQIVVDRAVEESLTIVVDIYRCGQQLFHAALAGTGVDNDRWVERKRRVVERFGHSSGLIRARLDTANKTIEERYYVDSMDFSAYGGSFPIIVRNVGVVGTLTVSGLTQEEDHALAVRGIEEFLKTV